MSSMSRATCRVTAAPVESTRSVACGVTDEKNLIRLERIMASDMKAMRELAKAAMAERVARGLPAIKSPEEKLQENPKSRALAITCMCRDCEGLHDPGVKWRIGNCNVTMCPLFGIRPYQKEFGKPMPSALADLIR